MADGALLLVDAAEGPLPQTRFVLGKALELGLPIIVVHQQDRPPRRAPGRGAQRGVRPVLRARGERRADRLPDHLRDRQARAWPSASSRTRARTSSRCSRPSSSACRAARATPSAPLQILVHNIEHDDYVGRLAVGRVVAGTVEVGADRRAASARTARVNARVSALFTLRGPEARARSSEAPAGDIVAVAGIEDVQIGDTHRRPGERRRRCRASRSKSRRSRCASSSTTRRSPARSASGSRRATCASACERKPRSNLALRVEDTRRAGHVHRVRPRRADAGDPGRDDAPRGLRVRARHARGRASTRSTARSASRSSA